MSDGPILALEYGPGQAELIEAACAFERGEHGLAATLWRERATPAVRRKWPPALADALCDGLDLVMQLSLGAVVDSGERAVRAWDAVERRLCETQLPLAGGRSTPAHFRKHKRDPEVYRSVASAEHLRLAGAGRAVAQNNHALALATLCREDAALRLLQDAASLRREAFGWREAGLGTILDNIAALQRRPCADAVPSDPIPVGVKQFLALAAGQSDLRRRLLAAAQLVPILRARPG
jgi:hypothetical protein